MHQAFTPSLFVLVFLLGLRHGMDWDHIAAIADITSIETKKRYRTYLGFLYIAGHASVIITFGLIAILVGLKLPDWVDMIMEPFVGISLIVLGLWLILSILQKGNNFRLVSRWGMIYSLLVKTFNFFHNKFAHTHHVPHLHYPEKYGKKASFIVGMIHGIGAETPTQILLFMTAAGTKTIDKGIVILMIFVLGLVISNSLITLVSVAGHSTFSKNSHLRLVFVLLTAVVSVFVGILFLIGKTSFLPSLFGG